MTVSRPVIEFTPTKLHELSAKLVGPVARWLGNHGVDPNIFTGLSLILAVGAGGALWSGRWLTAGLLLAGNGLCDVADGILARAMPHRSERLKQMGVFLDPAVDRINDGFLFIGLIAYGLEGTIASHPVDLLWYRIFFGLLLAAAIAHPISSYYRARIESMRMRFQEKKPLTRAGFHLALVLVILGMWLLPADLQWQYYLMAVTLFVSLPTLINLGRRFRRSIKLFDQFREQ